MNLPRPEVILFDAAGTLLHPAHSIGKTYAEVARHYGQNWDADLLKSRFYAAFRRAQEDTARVVPSNGDDRAWWRDVVRATLPALPTEFPFEAYFEELYGTYERAELWRVFPEVPGVLEDLRHEGYRLALASNWDSRLNAILDGLEIGSYFERRYISAERGAKKPNIAYFGAIERELGVPATHLLMVGDDAVNDYAGPRAAGWQALLLQRPEEDLTAVSLHLLRFQK